MGTLARRDLAARTRRDLMTPPWTTCGKVVLSPGSLRQPSPLVHLCRYNMAVLLFKAVTLMKIKKFRLRARVYSYDAHITPAYRRAGLYEVLSWDMLRVL